MAHIYSVPISNIFTQSNYFSSFIDIKAISAPSNPNSGIGRLYHNTSDGKLYFKTSGGTTVELGGGTLTDVSNVGTGDGDVYRDTVTGTINLKTIKAGTNITVTNNADDITIAAAGGVGEANTASNLTGTAGAVGVFKQKSTFDLEFKKINAGSTKVTIADDTGNDEIDIDVDESALDLANIGGTLGDGSLSANVLTIDNSKTVTNKDIDSVTNTIKNTGPFNYEVFKDGSNWIARNTDTGVITSTDTTFATVLQAAIDALSGSRTAIESVKVKGVASLTTVISVPSYTFLELTDAKITLANSTATHMFINSDTTNGNTQIHIVGGIIDGNKTNQSATPGDEDTRNIIQFTKVTDSSISKMYIDEASARAIRFNDCTNCVAKYNTILDTGAEGIQTKDGSNNKILYNTLNNTGYSFITTYGTEDALVHGNNCDTTASSSTSGINISSLRNKVTSNTINGAGGASIYLSEATSDYEASGVQILNNILTGSQSGGGIIGVEYPLTSALIFGNIIFANELYGIRFSGAHKNIIINGNYVHTNGDSGIGLFSSGGNNISYSSIVNNICYNNGQNSGADATRNGIIVDGDSADTISNIKVLNNICYDDQGTQTQKWGITLDNSNKCDVYGNNLQDNDTDGLQLTGTNNNLRIFENPGYSLNNPTATTTGTETHTNKTLTSPTINSGTLSGTFTLPPTASTYLEYVKAHTDSAAELLAKWRLDEATTSCVTIENATSTNGIFAPSMWFKQLASAAVAAGFFVGQIHGSFDSGSIAALVFDARNHSGAALSTRPLVSINNAGTQKYVFGVNALDLKSSQSIINSIFNLTNNVVTTDSAATGDILVHNGTKYDRLGIGTAGQYLKVNPGATAPVWESDSLVINMDDLDDVTITSVKRHQDISFDGTNYINAPNGMYHERHGEWFGLIENVTYGTGLLAVGLEATGSITKINDTISGFEQSYLRFETVTASSIETIGLKQTVSYYRMQYNSSFFVSVRNNSYSSNIRAYYGFASTSSDLTTDTPLESGVSGILVGQRSADNGSSTTLQIFHNDASGTQVQVDTGVVFSDNSDRHDIEIVLSDDPQALVYIDGTLVATITTDLPAVTTDLYPHWTLTRTGGADKEHELIRARVGTK